VVTLAIWGAVTPAAILTKCRVWGDMVDVITCAIFGNCRLRGVGVVRGVSLPSPIDLTYRPYNTVVTKNIAIANRTQQTGLLLYWIKQSQTNTNTHAR